MVKIGTNKSTFTNLNSNNVIKPEYVKNNITPALAKIETIDFDLFTEQKETKIPELSELKSDALTNAIDGVKNPFLAMQLNQKLSKALIDGEFNEKIEFEILSKALKEKCNYNQDNSYTRLYEAIIESYNNGNKEIALFNLEALAIVNDQIVYKLETDRAYVRQLDENLFLYTLNENSNAKSTAYHEFGHIIHGTLYNYKQPENIEQIIKNAQENAIKNSDKLYEFEDAYMEEYQSSSINASKMYDHKVDEKYGNQTNYRNQLYHEIVKNMDNGHIQQYLENRGLSEKTIESLEKYVGLNSLTEKINSNNQLTEENKRNLRIITMNIIEAEKKHAVDIYKREKYIGPVTDIISAIYRQQDRIKINGEIVMLPYNHSNEYWNRTDNYEATYREIVADINELKMKGQEDKIEELREIFGDELFDTVETMYEDIQN